MQSTNIHQADEILGSFESDKIVNVGSAQSMGFRLERRAVLADKGETQQHSPRQEYWRQKEERVYETSTDGKIKTRWKRHTSRSRWLRCCEDRCEASGIATTYEEETVVEGFGKLKGLKLVLWERGLIDGTKLSFYSKDEPKAEAGRTATRRIAASFRDETIHVK
jgi:hypothetical protein